VLWSAAAPTSDIHGDWTRIADTTAAGGAALRNPNRGRAKIAPALSAPANYFEMRFSAAAGGPYHLWVRFRAENDSTANDSVHVQFNDSVDAAGRAVMRIGTSASAEVVLQAGPAGAAPSGWGWADNGWGLLGTPIYFASSNTHTVRVQQREDGAIVDQIVVSRDAYVATPPGGRRHSTVILAARGSVAPVTVADAGTWVVWAAHVPDTKRFGTWQRIADATAAGGYALRDPNVGTPKIVPALANPANYFEATFQADAGTPYHVWVRMRAEGNSTGNDSVYLQFTDSRTASGAAHARIGTSSAAEFVLQNGPSGAPPSKWGWADNGWGSLGAHVYFATTGTHTVRVQQREDGAVVDQIVISRDRYLTASPGARRDDATKLPAATTTEPISAPPTTRTWKVVFTASTDHWTSVISYQLDIFAAGANLSTALPKATSSLGKPTPNPSHEISIDRSSFFNALPAGSYLATVSAVGWAGSARSAPYAFTR
jgi:hypothetical protein